VKIFYSIRKFYPHLTGINSKRFSFYKKNLLNTTQLAGWMKTGSPKAINRDIRWA